MASPVRSTDRNGPLGGPASVVDTACTLDCPDSCSLAVTVRHGKLVNIDGSHKNPVTEGFICAKVRKFGERIIAGARCPFGKRNGHKTLEYQSSHRMLLTSRALHTSS